MIHQETKAYNEKYRICRKAIKQRVLREKRNVKKLAELCRLLICNHQVVGSIPIIGFNISLITTIYASTLNIKAN